MRRCAEGHVFGRDEDDVTDAVRGQIVFLDGCRLVDGFEDFVALCEAGEDVLGIRTLWQVSCRKGPKRAMVNDVGVGDWKDHAGSVFAEPVIKQVLHVDHRRIAVGVVLGFHAMVGSHDDGSAHCVEFF